MKSLVLARWAPIRSVMMAIVCGMFHATGLAQTQVLPNGALPGLPMSLLPPLPTSADSLRLIMPYRSCPNGLAFTGNPYRVSMSNNHITITLGNQVNSGTVSPPVCPPGAGIEIDMGRLPPGNYTMSLVDPVVNPPHQTFSNIGFSVGDARAAKVTPYVGLDYSGHWWDPSDSGWGLFIWHDAADNVLAAWFTYGTDGKPIWWVFQPRWQFAVTTHEADLLQTARLPGPTSPPPNPTTNIVVGKAKLDFRRVDGVLAEIGVLTYTIGTGPTITRTIQRFKP